LCAEGEENCGATDNPPTVTVPGLKKWNPGHYVKIQGNPSKSDRDGYISDVTRALRKVEDSPKILGAQVKYAWGVIEPSLGRYDWKPIYEHLNYLSARGKKLIITIDAKCFSTDCKNLAPAELASEVFLTPRDQPTQVIEIWEEENMNHLIALTRAMAAEFDGHPDVEMILSTESTASLQGGDPVNYTRAKYAAQLKRLYSAQAAAFKSTNVVANINYLSGQVADLMEYAYREGVGRGMPDVEESTGSLIFRGACDQYECGIRDYRGLVPHFGLVSSPTLRGRFGTYNDTPDDVINYGIENKITHYSWVAGEYDEDSWASIVKAIEAKNVTGHTECPKVYEKGC
jgi:hypothetical protein